MRKGSSLLCANDFARFVVRLGGRGWNRRTLTAEITPACARPSPIAQGVFWILDLLANRFKQLADSHPACRVSDKSRDKPAGVRVNGVSSACLEGAIGFQQPRTVANF